MPEADVSPREASDGASQFATTNWSVILEAADPKSPRAHAALGALYKAYSQPLYVYVRRRGQQQADAQDLLHGFFHALIEKNYLKSVVRERGRFRAFLLGSLKHFLANEWHFNHRAKRGGAAGLLSLDDLMANAERRFQVAAAEGVPPEVLFDREWAHTLLARVVPSLRREWEDEGRGDQYAALRVFLIRPGEMGAYREAGGRLGLSEGAVKVAVHRLRLRFREILRREVGATVGPAGDLEDELRHLANVLRQEI
jgi:RNA polymerase sigma-70 factor (ECF subfamily)